jgi:hypothetical protein
MWARAWLVLDPAQFDNEKTMSLCGGSSVPNEAYQDHTITRLVMLTIRFPTLRLLWARDPFSSARIFAALKVCSVCLYFEGRNRA